MGQNKKVIVLKKIGETIIQEFTKANPIMANLLKPLAAQSLNNINPEQAETIIKFMKDIIYECEEVEQQ